MTAVDLIRRLHHHRAWVNGNLLMAAAELTDEQLRSPFPIGQGSVWKSLVHLYAAEYVWLEALEGNEDPLVQGDLPGKLPGNQEGEGRISGLAELRQRWAELGQRWTGYLAALTAEALDDQVYKMTTSVGFAGRFGTRRSDVLLHVCTHAQYTTAQIVNMLRHLGLAKPPESMLISLARRETAASD
ncbi:MAG TPA: DinB family protein [Pirellulales bacterium]|nr:DinB family protein [Pirellulales bacterium]